MPPGSRFCPHCGARVGPDAGSTAVLEPPAHDPVDVPVHRLEATPEYFGVTPPVALLTLSVAALAVAVLLFVLEHAVLAAVVLAVAILLLAAFLGVARRKPDSALARASASAVEGVRARAGFAATSLSVRRDAQRTLRRLDRELRTLAADRERDLRDLGEAVYRGLDQRVEFLTARLRAAEEEAAAKEAERRRVVARTDEQLRRARLEVQPTEVAERVEVPPPAPGPGQLPEN